MTDPSSLVTAAVSGDQVAQARLISHAERRTLPKEDLNVLHTLGADTHVVGVTGAPGSGKSTLVALLASQLADSGATVAVLAIDPTSPYSNGAILGDRIRMSTLTDDTNVFVRSMATRGHLGGLSVAASEAVTILSGSGYDFVIVETVGVGQDEVEIASASHTAVVVSVPGFGDDIQALKAGVLEIADIHVVNKSDLVGADRVVAHLQEMLHLDRQAEEGAWRTPILQVSATLGDGVEGLITSIADHRAWLGASQNWLAREALIAGAGIRAAAQDLVARQLESSGSSADFSGAVAAVVHRDLSARDAAEQLLQEEPGRPETASDSLYSESALEKIRADVAAWEASELAGFLARVPEGRESYDTGSGLPLERVYTPAHVPDLGTGDASLPGQFPFTRGPYPTMYRGRAWTMRQIAGFGQPSETNARFRYLIEQGQTGLSVDFDMPTLMGYDSDHPMSLGEVGREGVAVDVLPDMEALFDAIDLEQISVSMTINPTAWILLAMYVAVAEDRGLDLTRLSGTIQNDILKEYIAQNEWIFPIEPSMRIVRDTVAFASQHLPRHNPLNISGYHISEAGATAVQEAAFTMANARCYVRTFVDAGLDVDSFAPRLSFFFVSQADFFEEIAKFRALRRFYARMMKNEFGANLAESCRLRFHTQTAAATLTKPQPMNNIVRTTLQALSAVLGGTQSLHTNGMDEAYTIPSEEAMKVALRTQQIIAEESNVPSTADPLGGSYLVEALTDAIEEEIAGYLRRIDEMGGTIAAIESGFFQREIADSAYEFAIRKASGERTVVGVNAFEDSGVEQAIDTHELDPESEQRQIQTLQRTRSERDASRVETALNNLQAVAREGDENLMPATIEAVRAHASMGEIVEALREVFGTYRDSPVF